MESNPPPDSKSPPRKPVRRYQWGRSMRVGDEAVELTLDFLVSRTAASFWHRVTQIDSVENDPLFQKRGIDLIATVTTPSGPQTVSIEVKGDQTSAPRNFFLETVSDEARNTPGAFLACEADWYFYYFLNERKLHCLPLLAARTWFLSRLDRFEEKTVGSTRGQSRWITRGRTVPITELATAVAGYKIFHRTARGTWWFDRNANFKAEGPK